jgi:hypothetical protein
MSKQYLLLRKNNNTYYKSSRLTNFYNVDCPQSYPTFAWGLIASGLYKDRHSIFVSDVNTSTFTEDVLSANIHILDAKAIYCPNTIPGWSYSRGPQEYVVRLLEYLGSLYWIIADVPESIIGDPPIHDTFSIYQTNELVLSKMDITNYTPLNYPYLFFCTSGENPSFYQKDEADTWTETNFVERSTNLPNSEITIIRADDAT